MDTKVHTKSHPGPLNNRPSPTANHAPPRPPAMKHVSETTLKPPPDTTTHLIPLLNRYYQTPKPAAKRDHPSCPLEEESQKKLPPSPNSSIISYDNLFPPQSRVSHRFIPPPISPGMSPPK
ncbi:hypothetical protein M440DRAFT_80190 [Trichoderma longibrachiatum ATCC 18648]|uniref:Uncharacterized protein n=1 Tax=Trichoderma longibrachiatum ATCC 18648 TaxID=983965 RepID=A0A2T4CI90_TRILO|nr:hypothetical protein M440DRAFT_80190 [Trichoderma longibrachiatum ATCC 18648]